MSYENRLKYQLYSACFIAFDSKLDNIMCNSASKESMTDILTDTCSYFMILQFSLIYCCLLCCIAAWFLFLTPLFCLCILHSVFFPRYLPVSFLCFDCMLSILLFPHATCVLFYIINFVSDSTTLPSRGFDFYYVLN